MLESAKWIGLSVALHLAVATSLFFWGLRESAQAPQIIMVVIDNPPSTKVPSRTLSQAAIRNVSGPATPRRLPQQEKPKVPHRVALPATTLAPPLDFVPQQDKTAAAQELPPEAHTVVTMHQKNDSVNEALKPLPQSSIQQGSMGGDKQQRYRDDHFTSIRELITKQLVYPPLARRMSWSGKVVVAFTIAKDGSVGEIRIKKTSGFAILDKSALETIRRVAPFPRPPAQTEIVVPINFEMVH
ncbi:MAG: energy transducer TonB [Desulfuromonadaceae bacterium]|nr:energy transducer TonB [Desulfuromonadaceae bacterium]MDD2850211.1 energy transducer TonB [Desulfuromonadaceae bacterium]MDD4130717.1 energy transducer TonB [Desulfuromonadaceae bacterium]